MSALLARLGAMLDVRVWRPRRSQSLLPAREMRRDSELLTGLDPTKVDPRNCDDERTWRDERLDAFCVGDEVCGDPCCGQRNASVRDERRSNRLERVRELRRRLRENCGEDGGGTTCVPCARDTEPRIDRERRRACSRRRCWKRRSARLADRSWSCRARCSGSMANRMSRRG